jgi:hypothetical protein
MGKLFDPNSEGFKEYREHFMCLLEDYKDTVTKPYRDRWDKLKAHLSETYFYTQDMITISRGAEYEKCRADILKFMSELEKDKG